jgi:hypothetical protein
MEVLNYSIFNKGYFTCYDRISVTYGIIFNSEFVIFDILCNIIEETYGE